MLSRDERALPGLAPDINDFLPEWCIPIGRVGTVKVRERICLSINGHPLTTTGEFDIFVDVPGNQRAIHMSRNIESMHQVLWSCVDGSESRLNSIPSQEVCPRIALELFRRHEYANSAEVKLRFEYFLPIVSPVRKIGMQEVYHVNLGVVAIRRNQSIELLAHRLEVEVIGVTACPCAQNLLKHSVLKALAEEGCDNCLEVFDQVTYPTHMQRAVAIVLLESSDTLPLSIDDLITVAERAMSSRTYGLLKREDEVSVIRTALDRPRFVEDVARSIAQDLARNWQLREDIAIQVRVEAEESVHKHNSFAEITSTVGSILGDLQGEESNPETYES